MTPLIPLLPYTSYLGIGIYAYGAKGLPGFEPITKVSGINH